MSTHWSVLSHDGQLSAFALFQEVNGEEEVNSVRNSEVCIKASVKFKLLQIIPELGMLPSY